MCPKILSGDNIMNSVPKGQAEASSLLETSSLEYHKLLYNMKCNGLESTEKQQVLNEKYLLSKLCNSKVVGLPLLDNF
jgi:hypothetical protein